MPIKTMILVLTLLYPLSTFAHPGRTDAYGCHTCRTNCSKWGLSQNEYHCHASKGVEQPKEPVKSSATGVTIPAPHYKIPTTTAVKANSLKTSTATKPQLEANPAKIPEQIVSPLQKTWIQRFFDKVL